MGDLPVLINLFITSLQAHRYLGLDLYTGLYSNTCYLFYCSRLQLWTFGALSVASRTSLVAQMVKRLPTMRKTWVQSLGQEDPLEQEMATHSSTLAWKIPWTEKPDRLQYMRLQRVRHD